MSMFSIWLIGMVQRTLELVAKYRPWLTYPLHVCRFHPTFILPVVPFSASTVLNEPAAIGYRTAGLFTLLAYTGRLPDALGGDTDVTYKTLEEALAKSRQQGKGPICLFPEGTTSNNVGHSIQGATAILLCKSQIKVKAEKCSQQQRALLKFAKLPALTGASPLGKVYLTCIR